MEFKDILINNGVVEWKNRSLEELATTMLNKTNIPKYFKGDAVSTTYYVMNFVLIRSILKTVSYEIFKGMKPNVSNLHVFGWECFVLNNNKDNNDKFDDKVDEGLFLGYFTFFKSFCIYNKWGMTI